MDYDYIKNNIAHIKARISEAAAKSGRNIDEILLLAVTKTVDTLLIEKALDAGIADIGENRVQELLSKYDTINANWHMIGHLQTNKVKYIIDKVTLIHSVHSIKLADEINKKAIEAGVVMDVLVEVNMAEETSKFGVLAKDAKEFIKTLWDKPAIKVKGLMTVAPYVDEGEKNRDLFKKMRHLFVDINALSPHNGHMDTLSMGMTGDYAEAIEEGSTIIRIGTGIFGVRS